MPLDDPNLCDVLAIRHILKRDTEQLKKQSFHQRRLIYALRNDPEDLDYLLNFLKTNSRIMDSGSYHYDDIKDKKTFDIYGKYNYFASFFKGEVDQSDWDYCVNKGYIEDYSDDEESD